ncbi:MAG TPA: phosphatidate cytidylyltransferase [Oceanipulchritudo sp.]|nr:phosphatidate cytidylyltransferase [Oceanipulchritudo sp.]
MKNRILATIALWSILILLPYLLGKWGGFIIVAFFGMGSFIELMDLMRKAGRPVDRTVALPAFALMLLAFMLIPPMALPPFAIICFFLAAILIACLLNASVGTFTATAIPTLGSVFMLALPFVAATLLIHESGLVLTVWIIAVAKFGDVGALLTGMWLGKHRMAPAYSPKKTWEGLGGGIVLSIVVSVLFVYGFRSYLPAGLTLFNAGWMAFFITVAGVLADLMESAFKREANVKDSGRMIPGIGGFMDLTDSLLLAFPVGYFLIWLFI